MSYKAVSDKVHGDIKVSSDKQVNSYPRTANGHEHVWYNPGSTASGWHGDKADAESKAFLAEKARETTKYYGSNK